MYAQADGKDVYTDVVVVGAGPGGMSAACAAAAAGAQVVLIEATDCLGGNAKWSTGWVTFVESTMQKEQGITDSEERFVDDCRKLMEETRTVCGNILDETLVRTFARESGAMYDRMVERGVRFSRLIRRPLQASVDRLAAIEDTNMFAGAFESEVNGPNITAYLETSAQRLLMTDGVVKGLMVRSNTGPTSFKIMANKGVILATGGYAPNPALRHRYQREVVADAPTIGLDTCRGDGQLLGQSAGGDLVNMTNIPRVVFVASALVDEAIAVNRKGERFHNEAGPYLYRLLELEKQDGLWAYYIFDDVTKRRMQTYVDMLEVAPVQADTLEALAQKVGVPSDALCRSVAEWNKFLGSDQAQDPHGRVTFQSDRRPMAQAPFYAAKLVPGVGLSCGGLVTTETMQVVNVFGEAIPGLFAVGDCAGGFTPTESMGGCHLGGALTLGWLAGDAAATGALKPPHTKGTYGQYRPNTRDLSNPQPIVNIATRESGLTAGKMAELQQSRL